MTYARCDTSCSGWAVRLIEGARSNVEWLCDALVSLPVAAPWDEIRTWLVTPQTQSGGSVIGGGDALSPYLENRIVLEKRTNKQHCSVYFGHIVLSCYHVNMNA